MCEKRFLTKRNERSRIMTACSIIVMFISYLVNTAICYAGTTDKLDIGEKFAKWGLEQAFWICLFIVLVVLVMMVAKKAYTAAICFFFAGGLVCFLIKNPTKIETVGNTLAKILGI